MIVQRISQRAADLQGFTPTINIEPLQATRYEEGQEYRHHYDWFDNDTERLFGANRISTFFAILDVNCADCGTDFPLVSYDWSKEDPKICQYVECGAPNLIVKPIAGNAVFWRNLQADGTGDERTLHAGLPACNGTKVGLNIWTREFL